MPSCSDGICPAVEGRESPRKSTQGRAANRGPARGVVILGMRLIACTALCILAPTGLRADTMFPPAPAETSFAYAIKHTVMPLDAPALASMTPPGAELGMPAWDDDGAAREPDIAYKVKGVPREFSRTELCSRAALVAEANDLPVPFFTNLIQQESGFRPHVVSSAGAQGIAQFMPKTGASFGLVNPFDPIHALAVSARFLGDLFHQFGNLGLAAAAYNAGPKRVEDWLAKRGKLPAETRNYVQSITGRPAEHWAAVAVGTDHRLPLRTRCTEAVVANQIFDATHPQPVEETVKVAALSKSFKLRGGVKLASADPEQKLAAPAAAAAHRAGKTKAAPGRLVVKSGGAIKLIAETRTRASKLSLASLKAEDARLVIASPEPAGKSRRGGKSGHHHVAALDAKAAPMRTASKEDKRPAPQAKRVKMAAAR
jgi:hypothetical protein